MQHIYLNLCTEKSKYRKCLPLLEIRLIVNPIFYMIVKTFSLKEHVWDKLQISASMINVLAKLQTRQRVDEHKLFRKGQTRLRFYIVCVK